MVNNNLNVVKRFYRTTGFPGVIGCIDCTHVAFVPPSTNLNLEENQHPEYLYINRKNYLSINVQLVNIKYLILFIQNRKHLNSYIRPI